MRSQLYDVVSIVACGPSALKCGAAKAPGHVVAVNDAYKHVRHDRVLSMDGRWAMHRVPADFAGPTSKPLHLRRSAFNHVPDHDDARFRHIRVFDCDNKAARFGDHIYQLNGPNSGYCALNLAYVMCPRVVYLYGFDHSGGHFHPESEWRQRGEGSVSTPQKYRDWAAACWTARKLFDRSGIQVFNTNADSRISAFEWGNP